MHVQFQWAAGPISRRYSVPTQPRGVVAMSNLQLGFRPLAAVAVVGNNNNRANQPASQVAEDLS